MRILFDNLFAASRGKDLDPVGSSDLLGFIFPSFNLRNGIIQSYFTQPILALFCIVATTYRELIQKANGINNTHLFE